MARRMRIPKRDLDIATREEAKEHPWMTHKEARKVATDHLSHHPYYLKAEHVADLIMSKEEHEKKPRHKKVKPDPNAWMNQGFQF